MAEETNILEPNQQDKNIHAIAAGDSNYLCLWNNSNDNLYVRFNWASGGVLNNVIPPRSWHRYHVGNDTGYICWQYGTQLPSSGCPNRTPIRSWAGNCS